jgi:hypothetical protein
MCADRRGELVSRWSSSQAFRNAPRGSSRSARRTKLACRSYRADCRGVRREDSPQGARREWRQVPLEVDEHVRHCGRSELPGEAEGRRWPGRRRCSSTAGQRRRCGFHRRRRRRRSPATSPGSSAGAAARPARCGCRPVRPRGHGETLRTVRPARVHAARGVMSPGRRRSGRPGPTRRARAVAAHGRPGRWVCALSEERPGSGDGVDEGTSGSTIGERHPR